LEQSGSGSIVDDVNLSDGTSALALLLGGLAVLRGRHKPKMPAA
jgi:hypothetical protein